MVRVFCDFDGTVCETDVGREFFRKFAGAETADSIVGKYLSDTLTARESLLSQCASVKPFRREAVESFVAAHHPDSTFHAFAQFCRSRNIPLTVVSDGLDFYVSRILHSAGMGDLPWFANHAELVPAGNGFTLKVTFPYADSECTWCGNCKRNHMITSSADEDIIVYVGDGISDRCPVRYADFVFAKKQLIAYCQEANISYFRYDDFNDVQVKLRELLDRPRLKHRREAAMARREVFMQG
ncbi:MAG TPA: HAD-IB family phosphatase [Bacteroidota bacterium]|nr:HAD-IB family phosphatase [Bacteroidota bacterium]